tara:strand:+ start:470 stop:769 length:300 start_codon:yes stop_codon:yes gene_type:complete
MNNMLLSMFLIQFIVFVSVFIYLYKNRKKIKRKLIISRNLKNKIKNLKTNQIELIKRIENLEVSLLHSYSSKELKEPPSLYKLMQVEEKKSKSKNKKQK